MTKNIQHVAIILDGNRRWARRHSFDIQKGHQKGIERIEEFCECMIEQRIPFLTLYAWSTENWKRSEYEKKYIFDLFCSYLDEKEGMLQEKNIQLKHFGRTDRLPPKLVQKLYEVIEKTKNNTTLQLNLCLDYGGRDEIVRAIKKIPTNKIQDINEKNFPDYLDSQSIPDVDIMIRTSGEQRLSNFLLWQNAYAEFFFAPEYLPDFTKEKLEDVLEEYHRRERRKGK